MDVIVCVVDYDCETAACFLNIPNFSHERTLAPLNQEDRSQYAIRITWVVVCEVTSEATKLVTFIVVDSTYLLYSN
jgi:hypothetical protein